MSDSKASRVSLRPVLFAWALVAVLSCAPYLRAALAPPPGRSFVGFFYYIDDQFNYLSFVQQAEEGSFLFVNKLVSDEHPAALVNLEWWAVGRLSALLGRRPVLAYRLFGLVAALLLLAGADRWLRGAGLPDSHRLPALLLVATGAGLGGVLVHSGFPPLRCLDLATGLFPFVGFLANAHFVAGTALLVWALIAFVAASGAREIVKAGLLGIVLGLVRPYDLVMLGAVRAFGVILTEPISLWIARLLPLASLLPVVAYDAWLFYRNPAFAFYADAYYPFPSLAEFVPALAPAGLLALAALSASVTDPQSRRLRAHLAVWIGVGLIVILWHPLHFSLQFLVGIGLPLLVLGALGLGRFAPRVTLLACLLLGTTAFAGLRLVTSPRASWFVPRGNLAAALALRGSCSRGDVALTPPDIGQYVGGLTACKAYVSHPIGPDFDRRRAEWQAFIAPGFPADERARFLDGRCITQVVLPGDAGPVPATWLGERTDFRRVAVVSAPALSLYARPRPAGC